eukprot:5315785-Alexandrium_andersonii.AAC.1
MSVGSETAVLDSSARNPTSERRDEVPMRGVQITYGPQRRDRSGSRSRPFRGDVAPNSGLANSRDSDLQ